MYQNTLIGSRAFHTGYSVKQKQIKFRVCVFFYKLHNATECHDSVDEKEREKKGFLKTVYICL